ncbi:MAG: DASS family sodium-coupled anion symporter [Acidobacteria bacterium]|nr:DASS family sodium-coupled anion symporter [Acidobacteriota bacterium]
MVEQLKAKATAYDKYIDYKRFAVAVSLFVLVLLLPIPDSILDVAVEYSMGPTYVQEFYSQELFARPYNDSEQWQALTARALEACMNQGAYRKEMILKRTPRDLQQTGVTGVKEHFDRYLEFIRSQDETRLNQLMLRARNLRFDELNYERLTADQKAAADKTARQIRVCLAMVAFVIACFVTEAMPLPGVAFCIGLILVFSGIVSRRDIAQLFWSDAVWFIMGSLMFAAAFVKTGVDKRICLSIFRFLAKPSILWVTAVLILVISPGAMFISDHALAAIFLPIGIVLYTNSLTRNLPEDKELAKMLMITIAMACNIGGFGAPSGGARNVILITYLEDMFGITIGYGQWMLYGLPFVLIMMPVLWIVLNWRFKPKTRDLGPAIETLRLDIERMGGWNRKQFIAIAIFLLMFVGWLTEQDILTQLLGVRLGIGVIALAGAVAYLLTGVVNWRDYQEKVDWGVVWLYAGAIIFGRILDQSGTAYWLARSVVEGLAQVGLQSGTALLMAGATVTALITQLMADGPAAAAVGPITLKMAAVASPGTVLVPFMALATACASSMAYILIIGTPPNAIVYASGYLEAKDFLRVGVICWFLALAILLLLAVFYWSFLGFGGLPAA